jgi:hypothetical protein
MPSKHFSIHKYLKSCAVFNFSASANADQAAPPKESESTATRDSDSDSDFNPDETIEARVKDFDDKTTFCSSQCTCGTHLRTSSKETNKVSVRTTALAFLPSPVSASSYKTPLSPKIPYLASNVILPRDWVSVSVSMSRTSLELHHASV